jgi:hypothetical protein
LGWQGQRGEFQLLGELLDFQETAVSAMAARDFGVLCMPTEAGKTVAARSLVARRFISWEEEQMPFKDIGRRRAYDRLYKRQRRGDASRCAPRPTEFRAYICSRYPGLRLAGAIQFEGGLLVTADPAIQDLVEQSLEYGEAIFRLALVP